MIGRELRSGLAILRIERPEKANSLTRAMLEALVEHLEELAGQVPALILTGSGTVFSAGADLDEARAGLATDPVWERLSGAMAGFPGLTIAALNGTLAGGANGVALACDIRLGVPGAKFFYPVMRLGYLPQPSDVTRLTRLVGPGRARILLMGGAKIEAEEALAWGLIDRLLPADRLMAEAEALTEAARAAPEGHAARMKALFAPR